MANQQDKDAFAKELLDAAVVLILEFFKVEHLTFLLLDGLHELIDVGLLLVAIDLVIVLILQYVGLLHQLVLLEQVLLELLEESIVCVLEGLNMLVVVCELDLLSDDGDLAACRHT